LREAVQWQHACCARVHVHVHVRVVSRFFSSLWRILLCG
jgi:hypothetical protein